MNPAPPTTMSAGYLRLARGSRLAGRRWLARPRPVADPAVRVLCFPHVGGGAAVYNGWADRFPPTVEVCAVRLPGRENRMEEPCIDSMPALLDLLAPALAAVLDRPYLLFGHCSGSYLAFELSRRLRETAGPPPAHLVVSSIGAPAVTTTPEPRHLLPPEDLFAHVAEFGGIAQQVLDDPDMRAMFEVIIRADYRLIERTPYRPDPPLDLPVTVIGGRHDHFVGFDDMAAWRAETTGRFTMHMLPTGHFVLDDAAAVVADLAAGMAGDAS